MALTATTLAAACDSQTTRFSVTSSSGATVGGMMKIDDEYMRIVSIPVSGSVEVAMRGDRGGLAVAHNVLSPVMFGLTTDMVKLGKREHLPSPQNFDIVGIGANGVIPVPVRDTWYVIGKGSALASSTFADPGIDQDGLTVTFTGLTDYAHVVTTTTAHDGTTGLHTTLTSAAYIGSSITLRAVAGKWMVISNNLWVIS